MAEGAESARRCLAGEEAEEEVEEEVGEGPHPLKCHSPERGRGSEQAPPIARSPEWEGGIG